MADLFHMNIEEADLPRALRDASDMVAHVHLADSQRLSPDRSHRFPAAFRALEEIGFDGFGAIECRFSGEPEAGLRTAYDACGAQRHKAGKDG